MSYEETESPYDGRIRVYITRTYSVEIEIRTDDKTETYRCNLKPIWTFLKQKLKNVDWERISQTRDKKWGYKRIESDELFDLLSRN